MSRSNVSKRLDRLEALMGAARAADGIRVAFINSASLRPACVVGPYGRYIWWKPPEGYKVGELVEDCHNPESPGFLPELSRLILVAFQAPGRSGGPTTVIAPDGRLVWLEPPLHLRAGEPIEDSSDWDTGGVLDDEPVEDHRKYDRDPVRPPGMRRDTWW
jgi:hypothetical protein